MSQSFDMSDVDHFTVATLGQPGRRVFLIQFGQAGVVATLKMEKQQVAALSSYLGELLADLPSPGHLPEDLDLRPPLEVDWTAGTLAATYDEISDRIVLLIDEVDSVDESGELVTDNTNGRFAITREQAAAAAIRGVGLVEAGRPPCPLCGNPLDPAGHACPRTNGHRPPAL